MNSAPAPAAMFLAPPADDATRTGTADSDPEQAAVRNDEATMQRFRDPFTPAPEAGQAR